MITRRARKKQARRLAKTEGITYTEALSRLEPAPASVYIRQPTAEQSAAGVTAEESGVSALGPAATPGQRAGA